MTVMVVLLGLSRSLSFGASPVAWWTFDAPDFPGQDSAGTNNAALSGNVGSWAGVRGEAVLLDGAGAYLSAADAAALRFQGPMTVVAWAYANAVDANYPLVYKISSWDDGQMSYALDLDYNTGGHYPRFWVSSDGHGTGYKEVVSPEAISPGQWYLIAAVYDGANLNLYVNGKLENSVAHSAGIFPGTDPLYIGRNWNQTWAGAIDEVRLYGVALSASDILSLYQNEMPTLQGSPASSFGRVMVGQSVTNQVFVFNTGLNALTVGPPQITGPDAANYQVVAGQSGFMLPAGASNAVRVAFTPDAARLFGAELSVTGSVNNVQIALSGRGLISKPFTLELESIDAAGQLNRQQQTFQGSQVAVIVTDMWDSHPDPEMTARTCGLVQRMNQALDAARDLGITVIFSPSDCLADFDGTPMRAGIEGWPACPQGDDGFSPPLPPYADSGWGDMLPPDKSVPLNPQWSHQHPDLVVRSNDLASLSRDEIYNYCADNGISNLLYMGTAANMCVCDTREFSMVPMRRYCNFQPIMFRDLTDSMTLNGRSPSDYSALDLTMTPDRGHREAVAFNERYVCSTTEAAQLMRQWVPGTYTSLIATETNLLCYWRLDSKAGYRDDLDIKRVQSCWWYEQTNSFAFQVPGAIVNDPDTALGFQGASTILVSPAYRDDIPTNSPLVSLSVTNFSIEAWVQPSALSSNQWCFAHDDGTTTGVDVLFGISSSNRFRMVVGRNAQGSGWGDVVDSAVEITPADVASGRWFHVVATRDASRSLVQLYIDGKLDSQAPDGCQPVGLASAPHLGSRGPVGVDGNGVLTNAGFEFFCGTLDEMALYSAPLGAEAIRSHYAIGQGAFAGLLRLSAQMTADNQIQLSWPAWPPGVQLQATDGVLPGNWHDATLLVSQTNSLCRVTVPRAGTRQFFRLRSPK